MIKIGDRAEKEVFGRPNFRRSLHDNQAIIQHLNTLGHDFATTYSSMHSISLQTAGWERTLIGNEKIQHKHLPPQNPPSPRSNNLHPGGAHAEAGGIGNGVHRQGLHWKDWFKFI